MDELTQLSKDDLVELFALAKKLKSSGTRLSGQADRPPGIIEDLEAASKRELQQFITRFPKDLIEYEGLRWTRPGTVNKSFSKISRSIKWTESLSPIRSPETQLASEQQAEQQPKSTRTSWISSPTNKKGKIWEISSNPCRNAANWPSSVLLRGKQWTKKPRTSSPKPSTSPQLSSSSTTEKSEFVMGKRERDRRRKSDNRGKMFV
jgi:hypothetical protein